MNVKGVRVKFKSSIEFIAEFLSQEYPWKNSTMYSRCKIVSSKKSSYEVGSDQKFSYTPDLQIEHKKHNWEYLPGQEAEE